MQLVANIFAPIICTSRSYATSDLCNERRRLQLPAYSAYPRNLTAFMVSQASHVNYPAARSLIHREGAKTPALRQIRLVESLPYKVLALAWRGSK